MMGYPYLVGQGTVLPAAPPPMSAARQELEDFLNDYGEARKYQMFLNGEAGGSFGVLKQRMLPENLTQHFCGKCVLQLRSNHQMSKPPLNKRERLSKRYCISVGSSALFATGSG